MNKIKNLAIDMIAALNHTFTHLQSEADITLQMSLDYHQVVIRNSPEVRAVTFDLIGKRQIQTHAFQYYSTAEGPGCKLIETKEFNLDNMPEIEDYIIKMFKL